MWTAFGPTNVAIHRMTAAMELGDVQVAVDLAPRIDASALPTERRVRHAIETARAYTARHREWLAAGLPVFTVESIESAISAARNNGMWE